MDHPGFFERMGPFPLWQVAQSVGAELGPGEDGSHIIEDVQPLAVAQPSHVCFFDNKKYIDDLKETRAGACLVAPAFSARVPSSTAVLSTKSPYIAFAAALRLFYRPLDSTSPEGLRHASVDPTARVGNEVKIAPGAIISREAVIGDGSVISAGAVIGPRVVIGNDSFIGSCASVTHAIVGQRVIIHAGVRIGQDGFGFAMGPTAHVKVPQVGRVIIGDDVEIGANSTIDRGAMADTVVGEGTKIDNLVQIGHNVVIGKHCVIVAQSGIAGSAKLGDFVVMGGHSGVVGHVTVGRGAQIAGMAHVKDDVAPGQRMGGTPAVPFKEWAREIATIKRLSRKQP